MWINRARVFKVFVLLSLALAPTSRAQVLVLQYSDSHSDYAQLPNFIRTISRLSQEFTQANPDGRVLLIANGDIAGTSPWAEFDLGALSYRLLSKLSSLYSVAVTLGNHEGLDIRTPQYPPHTLFLDQIREFVRATPGQAILAANMRPTPLAQHLFKPFQDIVLADGKKLRIIGMTVENFFPESLYSFTDGPQLFLNAQPTLFEEGKRQLLQAGRDGVSTVVFECHEMAEVVGTFARELLDWKAKQPGLSAIQIPLFGAGHKHQVVDERLTDTRARESAVVEAGSHYALSAIVLDAQGKLQSVSHWSHESQKLNSAFSGVRAVEQQLITEAEQIVAQIQKLNARVIAPITPHDSKNGLNTGTRKALLGRVIATAFADWARTQLPAIQGIPTINGVIAFVNTLSFWDVPALFEGNPLTLGMIKTLIPFNGNLSARVMSGADIQKAFQALRTYGLQSPSPFLTPSVDWGWAVSPDGSLLETQSHTPIVPDGRYLLVSDHWIGANGYQVPGVTQAYSRAAWTGTQAYALPALRDLLEKHITSPLVTCAELLKNRP